MYIIGSTRFVFIGLLLMICPCLQDEEGFSCHLFVLNILDVKGKTQRRDNVGKREVFGFDCQCET